MALRDAYRVPWRRTITRSSLFHLIRQNELKTGGSVLEEINMKHIESLAYMREHCFFESH